MSRVDLQDERDQIVDAEQAAHASLLAIADPTVDNSARTKHTLALIRERNIMFWRILFWSPTVIGGLLALVQMAALYYQADSSPQQAAGAALAIAWVVIPYCVARALTELNADAGIERFLADLSVRLGYSKRAGELPPVSKPSPVSGQSQN